MPALFTRSTKVIGFILLLVLIFSIATLGGAQEGDWNLKLQIVNPQGNPVNLNYKIVRIGPAEYIQQGKTGTDGIVIATLPAGRYEVTVGAVRLPPIEIREGEKVEKVITYDLPVPASKPIASARSSRRKSSSGSGFLPILLFSGGLVMTWVGNSNRKMKRLVERLPKTPLSSLQPGLVEVQGKIQAPSDKLFVTPISKKECVYYDFYVEEERGKHDRTLAQGQELQPFWVTDGGKSVLVDPNNAEIEIHTDTRGSTSAFKKELPPDLQAFLETRGIRPKGFLGLSRSLRYKEHFLVPGDELYIIGTVKPLDRSVSNMPNDAIKNVMIGQAGRKAPFLISDRGEENLIKRFGRARWQIPLGILLTLAGVAMGIASFTRFL